MRVVYVRRVVDTSPHSVRPALQAAATPVRAPSPQHNISPARTPLP